MMRSRALRLSLCLLLAVATMTLGALSVRRKVAAFQPLGFTADREHSGGVVRVDRVDDPQCGVQAGDEILLVNGGEVGGEEALAQRLRGRPAAELAVLRANQVLQVAYHRPPLAPDIPYLILAVVGALYLLIGLYTLTRQRSREGFIFCLWCLASALLYLVSPVPPVDGEYRLAYFGDQLARSFLPALTLHLFLIFPPPLRGLAPAGRPDRVPLPAGRPAADPAARSHAGERTLAVRRPSDRRRAADAGPARSAAPGLVQLRRHRRAGVSSPARTQLGAPPPDPLDDLRPGRRLPAVPGLLRRSLRARAAAARSAGGSRGAAAGARAPHLRLRDPALQAVGHRGHRARRPVGHADAAARRARLLAGQPGDHPRHLGRAAAGAQPAFLRRRPG